MVASKFRSGVLVVAIIFGLAGSAAAAGSGALRVEIADSEAHGKGSAFVGEADNPSAVFYNPAGMSQMEGTHFANGYAWLQPQNEYEDASGNVSQMNRQSFWIPHIYAVSDLGLEKFTFGAGGASYFGLGTAWNENSFSRYVATKSDVKNIDSMIAAAYQVNEKLSFGIAADHDYSTVNKSKKLSQAPGADGNFQLKGKGNDWGYRLSSMYKLSEKHQFGVQYRSAIQKEYKGKVYLNELTADAVAALGGASYQAVFGGASFEADVKAELELPQSVVVGYSFTPNDKWRFNLDVEWMDWSSVEQEHVVAEDVTPTQKSVIGALQPRDWNDAWAMSCGAEYNWSDSLRLRAGYYFHESVIPEENIESNLPDTNSHSFTLGFGYDIKENVVLDMAYSGMFFDEENIDTNFGSGTIDGTYRNYTQFVMMTVGWKF